MAVAEARFYDDSDYKGALAGYDEVLKFPDSPLYDLALFKTAWCYWKLGDSDRAARRFKEVLDLGSGVTAKSQARAHQLTEAGRKRLEELKGEALEYLVQVFTEDERKGPKDAFDFLSSIGGAIYSRKVIAKLADTFYTQARYERAIESERFLIKLDPNDEGNPDRQKRIVEALREMDENKEAIKELRKLAETYGAGRRLGQGAAEPEGGRARAQARRRACCARWPRRCTPTRSTTSSSRTGTSTSSATRAPPRPTPITCRTSPTTPTPIEVHYLLGDIYFFKLKKYEEAGDAVPGGRQVQAGRQAAPRGAAATRSRLREGARASTRRRGKKELLPSDKKMGEAIDLYATLFPQDPEIANILLQERPALLRLRRVRRGGQALRPDRREVPEEAGRGGRRRQDPRVAQQGAGLRERRELGAAPA